MVDSHNKRNHSDELYTVTLHDNFEKGEKIPRRITLFEDNATADLKGAKRDTPDACDDAKKYDVAAEMRADTVEIRGGTVNIRADAVEIRGGTAEIRRTTTESNSVDTESRQRKTEAFIAKIQSQLNYKTKHGPPPILTTASLIAKQTNYKPLHIQVPSSKKSFIELAREYADRTHAQTAHIPFMCYWPSYEYMSEAQLDWYFYMRERLRLKDYIETDLSYLFVYIYELINQIGVDSPGDGLIKIIDLWINYRRKHGKLDRYLTEWTGDYIGFYKCEADSAFELLKNEGLLLLMPADMLADYYFRHDLPLPIELITRFSDYKYHESGFVKGADGGMFIDSLSELINDIRCEMNQKKEGGFEKKESLRIEMRLVRKIPFQRAIFHNPESIKIDVYPPYEQNKPFRLFITSIIKEFENQLRILCKFKGRLKPGKLPAEAAEICKRHARAAFERVRREPEVVISIDRERLFALIKDSDEIRKRLIEGSYEYDGEKSEIDIVQGGDLRDTPDGGDSHATPDSGDTFISDLSQIQRDIIENLLAKGGSGSTDELGAAFPGVFVGVEIDKINDAALESMGDLLIGFENERWYVIEDYIGDL